MKKPRIDRFHQALLAVAAAGLLVVALFPNWIGTDEFGRTIDYGARPLWARPAHRAAFIVGTRTTRESEFPARIRWGLVTARGAAVLAVVGVAATARGAHDRREALRRRLREIIEP